MKGDLAKIALHAWAHVDKKDVEITQTRKAGLPLTNPQLLPRRVGGAVGGQGVGAMVPAIGLL